MIRFEILLPLFYNDGRVIEREKFIATDDELVGHFGATSTDTVVVRGHWMYQSVTWRVSLDWPTRPRTTYPGSQRPFSKIRAYPR